MELTKIGQCISETA